MRVFVYSLAVTLVIAIGLFAISVLQYPFLNAGATIADGLESMTAFLGYASILVLPMLLFYTLAVAGVVGVIRRRTWWAGALAGIIPALLFYGLFTLMDNGSSYYGSADELATANTVDRVAAVASVVWCTLAAASLIKIAKTANAPMRRPADV